MNFDLKRPCGNCPFRREGGIRLMAARVRDIVGVVTSNPGGSFACHKTCTTLDDEDDYGDEDDENQDRIRRQTEDASHCAGALIFAKKLDAWTQLTQIASRLGVYDPDALSGKDEVFDSLDEMLATTFDADRLRRQTKPSDSPPRPKRKKGP